MNKKASAAASILVIILVIILLFWIVNNLMKECSKDTECGSGYYCGSDFKCHETKITEKTIIQNDFSRSAYIISFAIIIAAIIMRFKPKKIDLSKIIGKDPPTNHTYFSDEKEEFR